MRDRLADLVLACDGALESMRWTRHMRDAKNLQKGLVRMPALRKRMKAPLVMMPCRMPCDSTNGTNQTQQHALVAWHRLLAVPRTSLVKSSALLSSETNSSRQRSHVCMSATRNELLLLLPHLHQHENPSGAAQTEGRKSEINWMHLTIGGAVYVNSLT